MIDLFTCYCRSVECLESGWETVSKTKDNSSDEPPVLDMQVDASQLPLITNENGDQVLRFYWLDAYEDFFHQKGKIIIQLIQVLLVYKANLL